jgi:hypothetical protein
MTWSKFEVTIEDKSERLKGKRPQAKGQTAFFDVQM